MIVRAGSNTTVHHARQEMFDAAWNYGHGVRSFIRRQTCIDAIHRAESLAIAFYEE